MKTMKRFATLLLALILGSALMAAPGLAYAEITQDAQSLAAIEAHESVVDMDGLLSQNEIDSLNEMGASIQSEHGALAMYVTVDDLQGYENTEAFGDAYIDAYQLDKLTSNGCVLLVVCVSEGNFALLSSGNLEESLTSSTLDYLITEINPYLGRSDWAGAGETFFDDISQTLSGKTANASSEVAYKGTYVTDDYGLFSDEERMQLEASATSLAEQYDMGVYLLVVDYMQDSSGNDLQNPSSAQRTNFAASFYRANNLGLGSGKDGIMFTLAVDSRDYVTIAYGQGSYSFSDEGIDDMETAVRSYLSENEWYGGCRTYYSKIGEQLQYYSVSGNPWTEPDPLSLILKILAALGIPAGVAFGQVNREKAAMKTAREKTEAQSYLVRDSFELTHAADTFVTTTVTAVPIPRHEDSGGGGGGGFGGGGWGGGGGGGFSSSGGGKF